jgi:hypothetical protein
MAKEDKNKKKPTKSTKKVIRKKKTETLGLSALENVEENILPEKQLAQVEEVIKSAFLRFADAAQMKQHKVKDLEHLDSVASEFLKAFMILGYDLNGEKAFIMHATNPHDRDALVEHLRTTLLGIINAQS